ncbi:hypothetical protein [Nocardioides sp.]|uniref:hypothetical protein n=1 Tax=Nocardioides sp. TaxID=35761 RepID=UPI002C781F74|nr:hypothetical protein [Nocardioides sp.]HXH79794.1 hypothetical protein [Nocardioides sp.]
MSDLQVDLSNLRAWSNQVERAGSHLGAAADYGRSHISDGDFGLILELITADYEALISSFHTVLDTDAEQLASFASALDMTRDDFAETDAQVAQTFGVGAAIVDGGGNNFPDSRPAGSIPAPSTSGDVLPEVSFGFVLDQCCDLLMWVGCPDPREYVTKWIAGDIGKASLQAEAWEHLSGCVDAVQRNLDSGLDRIGQTWAGGAAQNASARAASWIEALATQSASCSAMAGHLRDMIDQAVQMAQVVVDIIKTVISLVTAALSSAYIPGWGQWKAIKTVKEAIPLINNARKVITVFWNAITMVKDGIIMIINAFSIDALPPAPTAAH